MDTLQLIINPITVYVFIVLAIRLFGKTELAQLSVVDLVFILLISNAVQNAMVGGDNTLVGGLIAAAALFVARYVLNNLFYHSKTLSNLIQGQPIMLIHNGHVIDSHLHAAQITHDELEAAIREHGAKDIKEVNLAVLEVDGNISILSNNYQTKTSKRRHAHKIIRKND